MQSSHSVSKAAAWMAGWLTLMVVIAVAGREATRELSVFQVMELRSLIGIVLLAPLIRAAGGLAAMRSLRWRAHAARSTVHYGAQAGWFAALSMIPLAQVVAIEFTMPIWTALLASTLLGERLGTAKIAAIALGLVGVALIARPSASASDALVAGQAIALAAAIGFAVSLTMVKSLSNTDSAAAIMFWMLVVQSLLGAVPALWTWRDPSAPQWGWIVVVAICGTFSHYCMARAMRHAEATVVVPMDFLRLPLTALVAWAVYDERMDLLTIAGAGLILAGNAVNVQRAASPAATRRVPTSE